VIPVTEFGGVFSADAWKQLKRSLPLPRCRSGQSPRVYELIRIDTLEKLLMVRAYNHVFSATIAREHRVLSPFIRFVRV
jgi:hypothetical protein